MRLWLVGKTLDCEVSAWEFAGIFDEKEKAVAACREACYFVAPVVLNKQLPEKTEEFPGYEYPLAVTA